MPATRGAIRRARIWPTRGRMQLGGDDVEQLFWLLDTEGGFTSGVDNLDPELTINGVTETPVFRYKGGDADATDLDAWTYGETMTAQGSGGTFNTGSPYLGANDDSFYNATSRYYTASGSGFADIATEDFVVEAVFKTRRSSNNNVIISKRNGVGNGVWFAVMASGQVILYHKTAAGQSLAYTATNSVVPDCWYHVIYLADRSGSVQGYVNAAASGAPVAAQSDTLSNAGVLAFAANEAGSFVSQADIAYLAMWKRDAWLDSHLQPAIALERYQRLAGLWPTLAIGTSAWVSYTRATAACLGKTEGTERKVYQVGAGAPRLCERWESDGVTDFQGYLSERAGTNNFDYSDDLTNWTASNVTIDAAATDSPLDWRQADGIETASADGDVTHEITKDGAPDATEHIFSALVKAGAKSWVRIASQKAGPVAVGTYFNLATATEGTSFGTPNGAGIEPWGNGWHLVWLRYAGPAASHTHSIGPAEADGDYQYVGTDSVDIYVCGLQHEKGPQVPSSRIPTDGASATRNADVLYFKGDDGNIASTRKGTLACDVLIDGQDSTFDKGFVALTDGGGTADYIQIYTTSADVAVSLAEDSSIEQWSISGTTDVTDGDAHAIRTTWQQDDAKLYVDGSSEGAPDTSGTPPDAIDRIEIGAVAGGTDNTEGLVRDIRAFNLPEGP